MLFSCQSSPSTQILVLICCLTSLANGFHVNTDRLPSRRFISQAFKVVHPSTNPLAFQLTSHYYYKNQIAQRIPSILSQTTKNDNEGDPVTIDPATKTQIRSIARHLSKSNLNSLLSKSDALAISHELFFFSSDNASPIFNNDTKEQYLKYWAKLTERLKSESRTPKDLLGSELTDKILKTIRGDNDGGGKKKKKGSYDADTVRSFLESDAVNSLFARLLYDAIFEFTTKFDILGNAISNLPLLGPMRAQILKESKRNMDRTLGPLLQRFLSGYTRIAIRQAIDFIVSEENASSFGKANAGLVSYLLEKRSVMEWIPEEETLLKWREDVWEYLVGLEEDGDEGREERWRILEQSMDWTYDLVGDKAVVDLGVDVDSVLDSSLTLERKLGEFWKRCLDASQ